MPGKRKCSQLESDEEDLLSKKMKCLCKEDATQSPSHITIDIPTQEQEAIQQLIACEITSKKTLLTNIPFVIPGYESSQLVGCIGGPMVGQFVGQELGFHLPSFFVTQVDSLWAWMPARYYQAHITAEAIQLGGQYGWYVGALLGPLVAPAIVFVFCTAASKVRSMFATPKVDVEEHVSVIIDQIIGNSIMRAEQNKKRAVEEAEETADEENLTCKKKRKKQKKEKREGKTKGKTLLTNNSNEDENNPDSNNTNGNNGTEMQKATANIQQCDHVIDIDDDVPFIIL